MLTIIIYLMKFLHCVFYLRKSILRAHESEVVAWLNTHCLALAVWWMVRSVEYLAACYEGGRILPVCHE